MHQATRIPPLRLATQGPVEVMGRLEAVGPVAKILEGEEPLDLLAEAIVPAFLKGFPILLGLLGKAKRVGHSSS